MDPGLIRRANRVTAGRDAGFTLIELVVVVTVLALLSASVTVGIGAGQRGAARSGALSEAVAEARDTAILSRRSFGLRPFAGGWEIWERARSEDGATGTWHRRVSEGTTAPASWTVRDRPVLPDTDPGIAPTQVPVLILPDGRVTPFDVAFAPGTGGSASRRCATDGWMPLTCQDN